MRDSNGCAVQPALSLLLAPDQLHSCHRADSVHAKRRVTGVMDSPVSALRSTEGVNRGQAFGFIGCFAFPQETGPSSPAFPPENTRSNPVCAEGGDPQQGEEVAHRNRLAFRWSGGAISQATKWGGCPTSHGRIRHEPTADH